MENSKYVVFKRDEFVRCMNALRTEVAGEIVDDISGRQLEDAVVIRLRDKFAGAALYGYANTAANAIDILKDLGQVDGEPLAALERIRDKFFEFGQAADAIENKRLPD